MLLTTGISVGSTLVLGMADAVFAGHLFGEDAIAAVNLLCPVVSFFLFLAVVGSYGMGIYRSIVIGRCNRKLMDLCCSTGLWTAVAIAVIATVAIPFLGVYFDLIGVKGTARGLALSYGYAYWAVAVTLPFYHLGNDLLCSDGGHRHCRTALVVNLVLKLVLSAPLAKVFGMAGLALASALGLLAAVVVMALYLRSPVCTLNFTGGFSLRTLLLGVRFSLLDQLFMLGDVLKMTVVNAFVVRRFGEGFLPVVTAFSSVLMLTFVQCATVTAVQPVLGAYFGEGNVRRVKSVARYGLSVTAGVGLLFSAVLLIWPRIVTALIGVTSPELLPDACLAVRIAASFIVFTLVCGYVESYYLYIERFLVAALLTVFDSCVAPIVFCIVLGIAFSTAGFWFGLSMGSVVVLAVTLTVLMLRFGNPYLLEDVRERKIFIFDLEFVEEAIVRVSEKVAELIRSHGFSSADAQRAPLVVEEVLMSIRERNAGRLVSGEVALDLNDGVAVTVRDNGVVFDLTDTDAKIGSFRDYLVSRLMVAQPIKIALQSAGINRHRFLFSTPT